MKKIVFSLLTILFVSIILLFSIRGNAGNINESNINDKKWTEAGPFELSPERGRFALLYSIVENHSFFYSIPVAKFAIPDLGYANGKFVSLFAPAVSFIVMPGYLIGKLFGVSQVGAFAVIALFAVINVVLIRAISVRIGLDKIASTLAALTYVFASPAFAYSVTLYQHQISTFLVLASIYILVRWKNIWSLAAIWFLAALSIPVDYPNLVLMFPIGLVGMARIVNVQKVRSVFRINVKLLGFLTFIGVVLPILFFTWFNKMSYNNPLQFSGTIESVHSLDSAGNIQDDNKIADPAQRIQAQSPEHKKTAIGFFQTRNLLDGFYIHFFSPDRGMVVFTPVMLFAIIGGIYEYRRKNSYLPLLVSVIGADVLLYSMWGDPWGGWAFGSRYLIPAYAVLSILVAGALTRFRKNLIFLLFFVVVLEYSVFVNTVGALTSGANPPKVEAVELEKTSGLVQKYTYFRNYDTLRLGNSKSYVFRTYAHKYLSAHQYFLVLISAIFIFSGFLVFWLFVTKEDN